MYALYAQRVGLSALTDREDYAAKYLASQGLGPLQLGLPMAMTGCLWAEMSELHPTRKTPLRHRTGDRDLEHRLHLRAHERGCARTRLRFDPRAPFGFQLRLTPALVAAGLVGYVFLESFALLRGVYRGDLGSAITQVVDRGALALGTAVGGSELSHPFITTAEILRSHEAASSRARACSTVSRRACRADFTPNGRPS